MTALLRAESRFKVNVKCKGIVAPLVFAVELSSVPENLSLTSKELLAIKGCSFCVYEEFGLSGYSESNEAKFEQLYAEAQVWFGKSKKRNAAGLFKNFGTASNLGTVFECATQFVAQTIVQSKLAKGEEVIIPYWARSVKDDAVLSGVCRSLTETCSPLQVNVQRLIKVMLLVLLLIVGFLTINRDY